jgi:E3 ubiquitin-protein ligase HUWE1
VAVSSIIDIIKTISTADHESNAWRRTDKSGPISVFQNLRFNRFGWASHAQHIKNLTQAGYDEDLAREAVYRANARVDEVVEYCRAHSKGLAGQRNPVPEMDAYVAPPSPKPQETQNESAAASAADPLAAGPMSLDSLPEVSNFIREAMGEAVLEELSSEDEASQDGSSEHSAVHEAPAPTSAPAPGRTTTAIYPDESPGPPAMTKDDLDKERAEIQNDLIDRCLDVIRKHPVLVFEVCDLVQATILKSDNEDKRAEVGDVLANALMSFAMNDEEEKRANGGGIAAYAHLLSLLLQNRAFFKSTLPALKQNIGEYLGFLKVSPASSHEELPSWIPYILLIFEILLSDDEQPVEVEWKAPTSEDENVTAPVWVTKDLSMSDEDRLTLLTTILDILPRVGKEEALAVSVLRILVILTRDHSVAKVVGEKRNLQRLFVMAKQSCSGGSARMNQTHISDNIMIILRHIVEDEDMIRQMMETEIRQYLTSSRGPRTFHDLQGYLRHLSHVALRAPKLFVEVTTNLVKLHGWNSSVDPTIRTPSLSLLTPEETSPTKEGSVEPAVQATGDLTIEDVKPTTESADKEMTDAPKTPFELKRPVLENPDGVVHFLLCELLNYREVDDKEAPSLPPKESAVEGETSSVSGEATPPAEPQPSEQKDKDKKSPRSTFKAEDHPIFVYRCFLLNCLAELLQSFSRAKVEFINFKRSAPMQTNTPIKPRSSVLNYLLNDLLCLIPTGMAMDSTVAKKKAATSTHAQSVLVALVARTPEKPVDRSRHSFEYDDDSDLLFVRRFVLDTVLRSYKEATTSAEPAEVRYAKMLCAAELMSLMIGEKEKDVHPRDTRTQDPALMRSQLQLKRLMYEKGYLSALTASIADIDLTFPNVKRTIKYILRVLRALTKTAFQLSQTDVIPVTTADQPEDDFASTSSLSEVEDDREETPDLYRNSTLGILEPGREEDFSDEDEDGAFLSYEIVLPQIILTYVDDDAMYDDEAYDDELDYGEEMSQDEEENPSDDDEEELGGMGEMGGEPGVVEVIMDEDEHDHDDEMDEDDDEEPTDEDDEEDDEMDSDDMEDIEDQIEIVGEEGHAAGEEGGSAWESDTDEEDDDADEALGFDPGAQEIHDALMHGHGIDQLRIPEILRNVVDGEDLDAEDMQDLDEHYIDDGVDDEGEFCNPPIFLRCNRLTVYAEEEEEEEGDEDEVYYDQGHHRKLPSQILLHAALPMLTWFR